MDSDLILWLFLAGLFTVGVIIGLLIGARTNAARRHARWLESELDRTRAELNGYQNQVTRHFAETAQIFNTLSSDYQTVYQHLASGCQQLCRGEHPQLDGVERAAALGVTAEPVGTQQRGSPESLRPVSPTVLNKAQEGLGVG